MANWGENEDDGKGLTQRLFGWRQPQRACSYALNFKCFCLQTEWASFTLGLKAILLVINALYDRGDSYLHICGTYRAVRDF